MASYNDTVLTNNGIAILNRVLAGQCTVTFTRAVSSIADYSGKTLSELQALTSIDSIEQNGVATRFDVRSQTMVSIDLLFTNKNLQNSYEIKTIGLYAQASDSSTEVLYAIATASDPETMPAYVDQKLAKFTLTLYTKVGQADKTSITITDEGVVKSINGSLTPDVNGDVTVDDSSHAKLIEAELIHGHLLVPLVDDSGNPITDPAGNQLIADEYLPKSVTLGDHPAIYPGTDNTVRLPVYTQAEIDNRLEVKVDQTDADLAHRGLQAQIDANLANEATARTNADSSVLTQAKAYTDTAKSGLATAMNNFYQKSDIDSKLSAATKGVVKSINSLTPDTNGNVVVDTSSHAKAIQEQLNSGKLYIPVLDDAGNPLTDDSGNVLLNTQYLPKTISINGGQKVEADSSNNINLQTYTKQAIKNWMETKADQTDADLAHSALQAQIDANLAKETADKADTDAHLKADEPILKEADSRARLNQASIVTDTLTIPLLDSDGRALTDEAGNVLTTQKHAVWSINGVEAPDNGDFLLDDYYTKQAINSKLDSIKLMIDQLRSTDDANLTAAMNNFYQKADIDSKLSAKLDASKAGTPSVITTPVDLNTVQTCGSYFIQNSLGTTSNTPIPNAWLYMRVEGVPNRLTQTIWKDIDPATQWVRVFTGSWGNWTQITKAI